MIYSLVETAKLNRVNPYYYLRYVLERMSTIPLFARDGSSIFDELMPCANCAADRTVLRSKTDAERSERTP